MMDLPFAVVEPVVVVKTGSAASPEAGVTPELVRRVNEEELHRQQQHFGRHPGDDDDAGSSSSSLVSTSSRGSLVHSGSLVHRGDPSSLLFSMATASATTSAAAAAAAATTTNAAAATTTKSAAAAAFSTRPAAAIAQGPYVNASSTASSLVSMGGGVRRDNFNNNHNHNINHSNNNHHHHHNRAFGVQSTQQQQQQQQPLSPPVSQQSPPPPPLQHPLQQHPEWQIDDTYVTVSESGDDDDEVDIVLAADDDDDAYQYNSNDDVNHPSTLAQRWRPSDVWALLLAEGRDDEAAAAATTTTSATTTTTTTSTAPMAGRTGPVTPTTTVASCVDCANGHVRDAATAQQMGNLSAAVEAHAQAAHCYRQAAWLVHHHRDNGSMAASFLLLSETQARTAAALNKVLRLRPLVDGWTASGAASAVAATTAAAASHSSASPTVPSTLHSRAPPSPRDVLRAKVRGALSHAAEADISESVFMGRAVSGPTPTVTGQAASAAPDATTNSSHEKDSTPNNNPVDDMMELERELRNMDLVMEMGSSIASLEARTQQRLKGSMVDGSFMVVAPPSGSHMDLSTSTSAASTPPSRHSTVASYGTGTASARARANRVQTILEASHSNRPLPSHQPWPLATTPAGTATKPPNSLDSSWWGNASQASQVLTSSVISLGSVMGADPHPPGSGTGSAVATTNTKQLLLHMDTFKTLRDENEALLKEVVGARAARLEAQAAKEQVRRFKDEYAKRFAALKAALERHRRESSAFSTVTAKDATAAVDPVSSSDFARSASASEQLSRQEQLIKKLTADLKKEKEESKKKDSALLKYETFYREVKARSAAKAAQRQNETAGQRHHPPAQHAQRQSRQSARFPR